MDKKEAEELKSKLFNKKENGWNAKTEEQKQKIFEYAKGYINYMNKSKTEREIINTSTEIAHQNGFKDIKEGTIYPLLVRLEKKGIITSEMRPSPLGPSRKYYSITPDGVDYLNEFKTNWKQISQSVNQIFDTEV